MLKKIGILLLGAVIVVLALALVFGGADSKNDYEINNGPTLPIQSDDTTNITEPEVTNPSEEVTEPKKEETIIVDNENFTFKVKGLETDNILKTENIKVFIENKTDMPLYFSWKDVSVNGFMVDPFFTTEIAAGKKENTAVRFFMSSLEEQEIENIEDVEFKLHIFFMSDENILDQIEFLDETFTVTFNK